MNIKKVFLVLSSLLFCAGFAFSDAEDTIRNMIPGSYYSPCGQPGTTELFVYKTARAERSAVVYLPYGYDQNAEKKYPVLYLMHGGGGSAANYLGPAKSPNQLAWILDNATQADEIEPMIIVCPTDNGAFYAELRNFLIPAIDEAFNTKADRNHRAFGGFSMGSVATWNVYMHDLDLVKFYIPMSGDSWVCGNTGGKTFPEKTALMLSKAEHIQDYKKDFYIFAGNGTADMAYPNLTPQIQAMKEVTEAFDYTTGDFSNGNLIYYVAKGNMHSYNHTYEYIYNALRAFKNKGF